MPLPPLLSVSPTFLPHVTNCNVDLSSYKLLKETSGYSGADIEAVVKDTIEKAFLNNSKSISTDDVINEIKETKPMSISLKDKIDSLSKSLEKIDVKKASSDNLTSRSLGDTFNSCNKALAADKSTVESINSPAIAVSARYAIMRTVV